MDLALTPEQQLLRDSAERFAEKACGFGQYQKSLTQPGSCDPALWRELSDLGWLALAVPEVGGGLAGSTLDLALVAEALGAGMVAEPYITGVVAPVHALVAAGAAARHTGLLNAVAMGEAQWALAYAEHGGRYATEHCATSAERKEGRFILQGEKHCVFNAPSASHLIVSARTSGAPGDEQGIDLFVVPREVAGLSLKDYDVLGGGIAANLAFEQVKLPEEAWLRDGHAALETALNRALAVSCAQALGAMRMLLERTQSYLHTRKQFGVPIGSFQVLQHRLVDMLIEIEQSRSMVIYAAALADDPDPAKSGRAASAAKAYLHKASKFVAQQAVQLHGGVGVTEELDVGHYFRQLTTFGSAWGDRDFHLARFRSLGDA